MRVGEERCELPFWEIGISNRPLDGRHWGTNLGDPQKMNGQPRAE